MAGAMSVLRLLFAMLLALLGSLPVAAHELDPGYLDIRELDGDAYQVFWRKPDVQGAPMTINARLPETCTPPTGPQAASDGSAWVAQWTAICPGGLAGKTLSIDGLEGQNTDVLVRFQPIDRPPLTSRLTASEITLTVPEEQSGWQVFWTYGVLGFDHILEGLDHLLFVLALVLLIPNRRRLVGAITAFTVAHSITLALAALGHLSVPGPPVEAIIALSVVFLAIEIIKRDGSQSRLSERAPWMVSFAFGLLHGLGFAGALQEIGLPDADIAVALLAFNLGVEAGQLTFVGVILVVAFFAKSLIQRIRAPGPSMAATGNTLAGYAIGGVATFWLAERLSGF